LIVNLAGAGRTVEAHDAVAQLVKLQPDFRVSHVHEAFPVRSIDERNRMATALREAGLPD
jgi:adenylate cyclase